MKLMPDERNKVNTTKKLVICNYGRSMLSNKGHCNFSNVFLVEEIRKSERIFVKTHLERRPFENK
jgi:hypothetical protein